MGLSKLSKISLEMRRYYKAIADFPSLVLTREPRENVARINQRDFDDLLEYSASIPTGAYLGKVWKKIDHDGSAWLGGYYDLHHEFHVGICWYRLFVIAELPNSNPTLGQDGLNNIEPDERILS